MKADYFWIIVVVIVVILVAVWKPIMKEYSSISAKVGNKDKYEAGKAVFYDTARWKEGESYMSCAMCHAADFVPDPGKTITMKDYVPGKPFILKGINRKYNSGVMSTGEELLNQINKCLSDSNRIGGGTYSRHSPFISDLEFYVSKQ
jgi:hypothetical protein